MALLCLSSAAAGAATYQVDTSSDSAALNGCVLATPADCSLRGAINKANSDSTADVLNFSGSFAITIATPLPDVLFPVTINAYGTTSVVTASYSCPSVDYAIDITDPAATPTILQGLPFSGVCGKAIRSNAPVPTISVGPRRANDTVPISGSAAGATSVDLFTADTVTTDGEADANGFIQALSSPGGNYAYLPPSLPAIGAKYTATATGAGGTSNFSNRATRPTDLTSPTLGNAVAVSSSRVRLDFSETINPASLPGSAFALGMGAAARPIAATSASGNSVFIDSSLAWNTGEAGVISFTGNGRVTDLTGNELLGQPTSPVYAGPGEVDRPTISSYRLQPSRICQKVTRVCKRGNTYIYITLNKPARVIFKVARGTVRRSELVTFVHRLKAGRNKVKFDAVVSGRTLPATVLTIRATAQDVARTLSVPVDAPLKIVKNKRDL